MLYCLPKYRMAQNKVNCRCFILRNHNILVFVHGYLYVDKGVFFRLRNRVVFVFRRKFLREAQMLGVFRICIIEIFVTEH